MADVLGISGQMDITDIQKSLDKLCDELARVGVDTDALSQKMTKALNEIAHSDETLSTKTQKAMQLLQSSAEQATKSMNDVPTAIDAANKRVETIQATIAKLNTELSSTDRGSNQADAITAQIAAQSKSLQLARADAEDLTKAYNDARVAVSEVSGAAQALSAVSTASAGAGVANSASNAAVSTSAAVATTAISAEAVAHTANAAAANQDAASTTINAHAIENLTAATKEYVQSAYGQDAINKIQGQSSKELANSIKQYKENIKTLNEEIAKRGGDEELQRLSRAIETVKKTITDTQTLAESASGSMADVYQGKLKSLEYTLDTYYEKAIKLENLVSERNSNAAQLEIAQQVQAGQNFTSGESNVGIDVKGMSLTELTGQLAESKTKLQELEAEASKFNGQKLTDEQQKELEQLNAKIEETKGDIASLQAALYEKNKETFIGSLRNKLSDMSQKLSGYGDEIKEKITKPFEELGSKISSSSFVQRFSGELQQAKRGLDDMKNGIVNVMTANGKFGQQIDAIGKSFDGLGFPVTKSFKAIKNVTAALWALCTTPIGAAIAAIALAFKAVHTWMTKSKEGQLVYTKLMAYFGSLASSVTDVVVTLGEYLYRCFTKPNGTLKAFGQNFVKTFKTAVTSAVNLVSGLGTTLKGVLDLDWDTFTAGLKQTWNGIKGAGETMLNGFKTGLSGAIGVVATIKDAADDKVLNSGMGDAFGNVFEKASKAAKLAGEIQETQIAIKKNTEDQAKLEAQIAEQKNKIYTLQGKEKIAAIETTKALVKRKYDTLIEQQKKLAELSKQNAELHTQSLASIAAERELRKDILKTQIQQASEQRMLTRQEASTERSVASASKRDAKKDAKQDAQVTSAEGKLNEVEYKNDYARLQAMQDLEQKIVDAKIEALEEGEEKVLAQRKRQLEKELEQIEKEKEAAVKAERDRQKAEFDARQDVVKAKGGKVRNWNDKIDLDNSKVSEIASQYDKYAEVRVQVSNQNEQKRLKEQKENERASVQSYLKEYGTSEEKRKALQDEAEDKKKKLDENKTISDTDREYQKKSIDEGLKKSLKDLDFQDLKKSINWDFVFGDLEHVSKSTLGTVKEQLKSFMDSAKDFKPDEIKTLVDAMTQIQDKMDLTTPISSIKSARKEYKGLSKEYKKYKQEYDDALVSGDVDKQKAAAEKMVKTEQKMVKAQNKEKASYEEVMNVAKQYAQALNDVGETIGGTTGECIKLAASAISAGLGMADGIKKFGDAVSALEKSVAILAIIEAALKAIQVITQLFGDTADATLTDYVETLDIYINLLNDSISDLNDSMSDAQNSMKDTIAYYEELVKLEKDSATAIKSQSQTWLNSGASKGFLGISSSSSEGVKIRKQIEKDLKSSNAEVRQFYTEGYNALNEYYKKVHGIYAKSASDFGRMDFLWELSDEDLIALSEDTKAMSLLGDTLSSAITKYAEKLKSVQDDEDSLGESLLSVSFDDFYDDFTSLIKDMDNDSEDFANNFAEYMRNALVKNLVAEQYKGKLEALYQKAVGWGKQGVLEDHIDELKKEYEEYANAAKEDVETIDKITGYEDATSQSATTKAIEAVTEDQASSLIGIGYAMQTAVEQGNEMRSMIQVDVSALRLYAETSANNISEMRDIQYQGLGQLQAINKNTQPILVMSENLENMYKIMKERY